MIPFKFLNHSVLKILVIFFKAPVFQYMHIQCVKMSLMMFLLYKHDKQKQNYSCSTLLNQFII